MATTAEEAPPVVGGGGWGGNMVTEEAPAHPAHPVVGGGGWGGALDLDKDTIKNIGQEATRLLETLKALAIAGTKKEGDANPLSSEALKACKVRAGVVDVHLRGDSSPCFTATGSLVVTMMTGRLAMGGAAPRRPRVAPPPHQRVLGEWPLLPHRRPACVCGAGGGGKPRANPCRTRLAPSSPDPDRPVALL